ncbi:MAG TPA: hypothetical protein VH372_11580 [Actinospica sp.]|nr:hypothetical protein [Actinospica sp.]
MPNDDEVRHGDVEFLDPGDPEAEAGVLWLDEEGIGSERGPARLPPHAARGRVLASLLALALVLTGAWGTATAAYHRHLTDRRLADELVLRASASPPSMPDLVALGFAGTWHAQVTERVLVPVVNRSPRPVRLLDAVLTERGLLGPARLAPVADQPLAPGRTGELAGAVTADCTLNSSAVAVSALEFGSSTLTTVLAPRLQVRARTSGGTSASVLMNPESAGSDLQQRICVQEGDDVTRPEKLDTAADPRAHTVTVRLVTGSNADVTLDYASSLQYSLERAGKMTGVSVSQPLAQQPVAGTVAPGAALTLTYVIDVWSCPTRPLPKTDGLQLQLDLSVHGTVLSNSIDGVQFDPLLAAACGLDPAS